jgi:hypothetical protein
MNIGSILVLSATYAVMAQLVEHWLPKPRVAGSSPVYRSTNKALLAQLVEHYTFNVGVTSPNLVGRTMVNINELKNKKQLGEIGERIAIGELSKYGIDIILPMSDNLPFDFVVYHNNHFYKCQVKTTAQNTVNNSLAFSLTSNNWNKGKIYKYDSTIVDIMICCDLETIYIFPECDVEGRSYITIRKDKTNNGQIKKVHFSEECKISIERLKYVFGKLMESYPSGEGDGLLNR